jgi:hypothetical protein
MAAYLRETLLRSGVLAGLICAAVSAEAQAPLPDLSSNGVGWIAINRDFVAVSGSPRPVADDPAHLYVPSKPTFRVADLTNPNLKPWARDIMRRENEKVLAGGIGYTARSICMPGGVPGFMMFVEAPVYFIQSPRQVVMIYVGDEQVRHVYLDMPHSENPTPSWYGESVGHYEGDTLVIDTIGLNDRTTIDNFRTPHTKQLHVTEHWKLADGGKVLEVNIRIEDPGTFNAPWSAIQRYRQVQRPWLEEVCAENNLQFGYHTPIANKSDF